MVDSVECGFQVCVEHPLAFRVLDREGAVDHLNRVVASATRSETILFTVQPGLPLRLQRVTYPLLLGPVGDNWNAEWALAAFLGDVHPPHRQRLTRAAVTVQQPRQSGPVTGGRRDL